LDTDMLSAILRRNPTVVQPVREYLSVHRRLTFSVITRYEILRGLKAKEATGQQRAFESFCAANSILPLTGSLPAWRRRWSKDAIWRRTTSAISAALRV
jgi:tRNA(fMet)-specific endonuclease VapC